MSEGVRLTREDVLARLPDQGGGDWEAISRLLLDRFSCRAYRPDPVPRATLDAIFAAAQFTSNWCNAQAWQSVVTSGAATDRFRDALYEKACTQMADSQPDLPFPLRYDGDFGQRRREAGVALYQSIGIVREDRDGAARQMLENYRFFGAPHLLVLTTEADLGLYGAVDCGIYLGNLMLLLQSQGIASIAQGAIAKFSPFVRDYFGIPDNRRVLCGLSFGYADAAHPVNGFRTTRSDPAGAVRFFDE